MGVGLGPGDGSGAGPGSGVGSGFGAEPLEGTISLTSATSVPPLEENPTEVSYSPPVRPARETRTVTGICEWADTRPNVGERLAQFAPGCPVQSRGRSPMLWMTSCLSTVDSPNSSSLGETSISAGVEVEGGVLPLGEAFTLTASAAEPPLEVNRMAAWCAPNIRPVRVALTVTDALERGGT